MPVMNEANLATLRTDLRAEFNTAWMDRQKSTKEYDAFTSTFTVTGEKSEYSFYRDLKKPRKWVGNRAPGSVDTAKYELVNDDYENSIEVHYNDLSDDQRNMLMNKIRQLAGTFDQWIEETAFGMLYDGSDATSLCWDGQPFFDANHPLKVGSGDTFSNEDTGGAGVKWCLVDSKAMLKSIIVQIRNAPTADWVAGPDSEYRKINNHVIYGGDIRCAFGYGDPTTAYQSNQSLTEANLASAYEAFIDFPDDEGRKINRTPDTLVVPNSLAIDAMKLVDKELVHDGTSYVNSMFYKKFKLIHSGYMA